MAAPIINMTYSNDKLGAGSMIVVTFKSNINMVESEVRATKYGEPFGVGIGQLIHADSYTPAYIERTFEIYDTHLTKGDGEYMIRVYGKSEDGYWNDGKGFYTSDIEGFATIDFEQFLVMR